MRVTRWPLPQYDLRSGACNEVEASEAVGASGRKTIDPVQEYMQVAIVLQSTLSPVVAACVLTRVVAFLWRV